MNKPVALNENDILRILQNAHSVPLGQPIWESTEEYNKLKAIIEAAISYTHPVKELTDEEIANTWDDVRKDATLKSSMKDIQDFAKAILRKAQEK